MLEDAVTRELPLAKLYQGRTLNVAHRGARECAPENTLPAFESALSMGADGVEFDVRLSADGIPIIFHDSSLDRTTNGSGLVAEKTLAQLRDLDAGAHFAPEFAGTRIPTLDEALQAVGHRSLVIIELKSDGHQSMLAEQVVQAVLAHGLSDRVLLCSFNPLILRRTRFLAPQIPIGYLYAPAPRYLLVSWVAHLIIGPHMARHPHFSMVNARTMRWARRQGYRVNVWTVNEPEDIRRMCDLGVDAIITDRPDRVRAALQGERK